MIVGTFPNLYQQWLAAAAEKRKVNKDKTTVLIDAWNHRRRKIIWSHVRNGVTRMCKRLAMRSKTATVSYPDESLVLKGSQN